jgi:hypothetical protein
MSMQPWDGSGSSGSRGNSELPPAVVDHLEEVLRKYGDATDDEEGEEDGEEDGEGDEDDEEEEAAEDEDDAAEMDGDGDERLPRSSDACRPQVIANPMSRLEAEAEAEAARVHAYRYEDSPLDGNACGMPSPHLPPALPPEPSSHLEGVVAELSRGFNESQCIAIRAATTERRSLTLIQGPPGTGKTRTALTILEAWLRGGAFRPGTILAASDSNIAVDNLLEGLARRRIRVVRLGRVDAVREDLRHFMPPRELRGVVLSPEQYNKELKRCLAQAEVVCCTTMSDGSSTMMKGLTF